MAWRGRGRGRGGDLDGEQGRRPCGGGRGHDCGAHRGDLVAVAATRSLNLKKNRAISWHGPVILLLALFERLPAHPPSHRSLSHGRLIRGPSGGAAHAIKPEPIWSMHKPPDQDNRPVLMTRHAFITCVEMEYGRAVAL